MDSDHLMMARLPDPSFPADRAQTEVSSDNNFDSNSSTEVFILVPCSLQFGSVRYCYLRKEVGRYLQVWYVISRVERPLRPALVGLLHQELACIVLARRGTSATQRYSKLYLSDGHFKFCSNLYELFI